MQILYKLFNKIALIFKHESDFKELASEITTHLINLCAFQRFLRRKTFPINDVICNSIGVADSAEHQEFLRALSFVFRREAPQSPFFPPFPNISEKRLYWVARFRGRIIAGVSLSRLGDKTNMDLWFISGLCVLKNFQGRGVGEKLVGRICANVAARGSTIYLSVDRNNFRARNLYKKLGFREDRSLEDMVLRTQDWGSTPNDLRFLFKQSL